MFPFAGPDERDLAAGVAAFVNDLRDRIPAAENEGTIPPDVIRSLGELGVLGMNVPERDGGLGASAVAFALVLEELAAVWPSLAVGVTLNSRIVCSAIDRLGTSDQKRAFFPMQSDGRGLAV